MIKLVKLSFILTLLWSSKYCSGQAIKIDHVITVVSNLEKSSQQYANQGFTIKSGRYHNNGLLNAHIKFENGTSYELMSVQGSPQDEIAKEYARLLRQKEGGVYIALSGISTQSMLKRLALLNIKHELIEQKNWDYIVFPSSSKLSQFFYIQNKVITEDQKNITSHKNGSIGIKEVITTGDNSTLHFLEGIGLRFVEDIKDDVFGVGKRYQLETGSILVFKNNSKGRDRLISIEFDTGDASKNPIFTF